MGFRVFWVWRFLGSRDVRCSCRGDISIVISFDISYRGREGSTFSR